MIIYNSGASRHYGHVKGTVKSAKMTSIDTNVRAALNLRNHQYLNLDDI
jgi:hypothetical protein